MLKNYIIIAWRNLFRNKSFSLINIFGLAVSMSVCLLILMIGMDQYSYDTYHSKKDRVYRVHTTRYQVNSGESASSALPLAEKLKSEFPSIEAAAAINSEIGGDVIYADKFATGGGYFADGNFFQILDYSFKEGNPSTALNEPFSLVISSEVAQILFGTESALGKSVKFQDKDMRAMDIEEGNTVTDFGYFTITGVLNPNPGKTHLPFKFLASLSTMKSLPEGAVLSRGDEDWDNVWSNYTYVLLKEGQSKGDLQANLDQISEEIYGPRYDDKHSFKAMALRDLSPTAFISNTTHVSVPKVVLLILGVLCLVVMFSACLNYTNMAVARSLTRLKEVGVRKVSGANKAQIFIQFITEAVVISLCSLFFAFLLLQVLEQGFLGLTFNQYLRISFSQSLPGIFIFIGFSILVGIVAGILPASYVAKLNPVSLFNNLSNVKIFKSLGIRNVLLVFQFSISLIFIISIILIQSQARHMLNFDYGFDKENIVSVKLYDPANYQRFAQAVVSNPQVSEVGATSLIPGGGWNLTLDAVNLDFPTDTILTNYFDINSSTSAVLDLKLIAGQNLPMEGSDNLVLINEFAVKTFNLGSNEQAVGKQLVLDENGEFKNIQVAGVVRDFQFLSPDRAMESLVLRNRNDAMAFALVKVSGQNQQETLAALEAVWKEVNPDSKFSYKYLDQELLFIHQVLGDVMKVIGLISFLAIFVSLLGLLGMAMYTAQTRVKEIGIRKTLGSSIPQIIYLLSKGFLKLLGFAILLAVPAAFFINNLWLNFFASKVSIGLIHIGIGVGFILLISLAIILSQAYRAAVINPIDSLKNE
ncbi:ABC transporter permease [Algoriphagus litoralis]|uniref:ABC transporter permease n=1 Tax=Algoriphagus litoralis TaxID=2202829 RepID=UPI001E61B82E|nr:ABC transporter permease [Algoriphagus litoralis]